MNNKKVVIWGVLSLIIVITLFFVIKNTNVISLIIETQKSDKVLETSYIDKEVKLNNHEDIVKSKKLVENNSAKNSKEYYAHLNLLEASMNRLKYRSKSFVAMKNNMQWGGDIEWTEARCVNSKDCSPWMLVNCFPEYEKLVKELDEEIDGSDGAKDGSLRWLIKEGSSAKLKVFLKYSLIKKPVA